MTRFRPVSFGGTLVVCALFACVASGQGRPQPAPGQPYFEFMVDKPVSEAPNTMRPRYPTELRAAQVRGQVLAQFVVDTAGLVEPETFKVLRSSHDEFTAAVRAALPGMRFNPAEVRGGRVRQLVQQPFIFAISVAGAPPLAQPGAPSRPAPTSGATITASQPPQGKMAGWVLAQRMTIDSANGRDPVVMTSRYTGAGGKVRMETSISTVPVAGGAMVTVMDSAEHSMTMIMDAARMASVSTIPVTPSFPRPVFASGAGPARADRLGPGEPILGMPTTRTHSVRTSSMTQAFDGFTCTKEIEFDMTVWTAADPTISRIQRQMARSLGSALAPESEFGRMLDTVPERADASSILRSVSSQRVPRNGQPATVTMTTEVIEARFGDVDASLFAIPQGYRVNDLRANGAPVRSEAQQLAVQARAFWRQFDSTATLPSGAKACTRVP